MIYYEQEVKKNTKKGEIPKNVLQNIHNVFLSLDMTKDLNLFDIKQVKGDYSKVYYRLRKGKYRAIFFIENNDFFVVYIGKREEVYKLWQ